MTDPTMTVPQERLGVALTQAWRRHRGQPIPGPVREAFLAAVRDLAAAPPVAGHQHPDRDDLDRCQRDLTGQLHDLHENTRAARHRGRGHRVELRRLHLGVRTAALATLPTNPDLQDRLRQALDDWGLSPLPAGFEVRFTVPVSVRVDAVDPDEAESLATARLADGLGRLPTGLTAHRDQARCIDITEQQ